MAFLRWLVGGLIGGAVGVGIWVLVGYFTQYEVGWIAWGVGFLVGVGVRFSAHLGEQEESFAQGIVAAAMAIGAIVVAKYLVFSLFIGGAEVQALRDAVGEIRFDDEAMIALIADDVAEEMMDRGQQVNWPPGMTYEEAARQPDYPPAIWQEAVNRWNRLGAQEQQKRKQEMATIAAAFSEAATPEFSESFSPWDLLWFGLATFTAFRIGVGTYGSDD